MPKLKLGFSVVITHPNGDQMKSEHLAPKQMEPENKCRPLKTTGNHDQNLASFERKPNMVVRKFGIGRTIDESCQLNLVATK